MKTFFKKYWILTAILIFAALLRLWSLGSIPPHLTQDEASLGYNAYSILKTGKDEYGKVFPIIFKSFGDYKPGLYVYLDVPFVAVMGLNEVAVRIPSAIAGVVSVYLVYLIMRKLFIDKKNLALIAAFVMSITPWAIFLSRGAWEVNVVLTLTLAGIFFFLKALEKPKYLLLSAALFASTLLTYQGAKLSTSIVILILVFVYWRQFIKTGAKSIAGSIIIGLIISAPIILSFFNGQVGRLDVFSIFSYPRPVDYTQALLNEGGEKKGTFVYNIYHSEGLNFTREILYRWFNHFSGRFLFFEGDYQNPGHSAPYQGMLLVSDFVILLFGFFALFKNYSLYAKPYSLILLWLILSPLPAVLTRDQVQSVRALNMVVPLVIVLSLGLLNILEWIRNQKNKFVFYILLCGFYALGFIYFLDACFIHVPAHNSSYWNYGYKQVVEKITPVQKNYKNIIVEQSFAQPYIYFLFFQKYNPAKYQAQASLTKYSNVSDVGLVTSLDNIQFVSINWSAIKNMPGTLVVIDGITPVPADLKYSDIQKIYFLNGRDLAFDIIQIQ